MPLVPLFISGEAIPKTHGIDQLFIHCKEHDIDTLLSKSLIDKAMIISSWEVKTRYVLGFKLEIEKVMEVVSLLDEYFSTYAETIHY